MKSPGILFCVLTLLTHAQEWKPVAPTEKLLYDISFEKDSPGGQPSGLKLEGKAVIVADDGSKALQLAGPQSVIRLQDCQPDQTPDLS